MTVSALEDNRVAEGAGAPNLDAARALARALLLDGGSAFVSPGSRNTPLAVAFHELGDAGHARTHVLLDERVAAFAALGAARASRQPTVLVCTSGTAGGHFLPAIMEADRARVPLIAITADRPPELHHCGAPQTIAQHALFAGYVRWSATLATPDGRHDRDLRHVTAMGLRARAAALGSPPGPVHLDAPFRKPLYDDAAPLSRRTAVAVGAADGGLAPLALWLGARRLDTHALEALAAELSQVERGLIHVGPLEPATLDPDVLAQAVAALGAALDWPVLADGASGLRGRAGAPLLGRGEVLARAGSLPEARFALRIGGAPTGQRLGEWLGALPSVLLDPDGMYLDPEARCRRLVVADPAHTCRALATRLGSGAGRGGWASRFRALEAAADRAIGDDASVAGIAAARAVTALDGRWRLHVASSMAIRDVDAFGALDGAATLTVNRGVNGIDGTIATALGVACATESPTVALLGDLAFAHDVGGLLAASRADVALTLVVIDNGGGGIFEMLPVARELERGVFERLFATPQDHDLGRLCDAVGASYRALDAAALAAELARTPPRGVRVLHLAQPRDAEWPARGALWERVAGAIGRRAPGGTT